MTMPIGDKFQEEKMQTTCPVCGDWMTLVNECSVELFSTTRTFECSKCGRRIVITVTSYAITPKGTYPEYNWPPEIEKPKEKA